MTNAIFSCENCGYRQDVDPVHTGEEFSCPTCGTVVTAMVPSEVQPAVEAVEKSATMDRLSTPEFRQQAAVANIPRERLAKDTPPEPSHDDNIPVRELMSSHLKTLQKKWAGLQIGSRLDDLVQALESPLIFLVAYLFFVALTYLFPSPGATANRFGGSFYSANLGSVLTSGIYVLCCLGMIILCFLRGIVLNRLWLVVYPLLFLLFSCSASLVRIPYIIGILHAVTILLGLIGAVSVTKSIPRAGKKA